jgi:hypothetical protein
MRKILLGAALVASLMILSAAQSSKDLVYQVFQAYQANDQGQVLSRQPFNGQIILSPDGTYRAALHVSDTGTWKLVKAGAQQPRDMLVFSSRGNFQFYGYPQQGLLSLWLNRSPQGISQWLAAQLTGPVSGPSGPGPQGGGPASPPPGGSLIRGRAFAAAVLYSATSAPTYFRYDESTGRFSEDQKGIIFRPDGTYYLKAEFGDIVQEERGRYVITGANVQIVFSDGSQLILAIVEGGRKLHWYSGGMLLSEFFFLGTAH